MAQKAIKVLLSSIMYMDRFEFNKRSLSYTTIKNINSI